MLRACFETGAEADLVARLDADGDAVLSLVAVRPAAGEAIVGHCLFSRMTAPFSAVALAPVAVEAAERRCGIAARLIEAGLARLSAAGWQATFVLGDPSYYGRFGFTAAAAAGFASRYAGPYLQAVSLQPGGMPRAGGAIAHAAAFSALPG